MTEKGWAPSGTDYIIHLKHQIQKNDNHLISPDLSKTDVLMIQNDDLLYFDDFLINSI